MAIEARRTNTFPDPINAHEKIALCYNWRDISRRTEMVYNTAVNTGSLKDTERLKRYMEMGCLVGPLVCLLFALVKIILQLCRIFIPEHVSHILFSK